MDYKEIEEQLKSVKKLKFNNGEHKELLFRKLIEKKSTHESPVPKSTNIDKIPASLWRRTIKVPVPIAIGFLILFTMLILSQLLPGTLHLYHSDQESHNSISRENSSDQPEVQSVYIQVEYYRDGKLYREYGVHNVLPINKEGEK